MSKMSMAIARARQASGGRHKEPRPLPAGRVTRDSGFVCPTCLRFGRADCALHKGDGNA